MTLESDRGYNPPMLGVTLIGLIALLAQDDDIDRRLREPTKITVDFQGVPASEAFLELARRSGEEFEVPPELAHRKVDTKLSNLPLFLAADELCRNIREARLFFPPYTREFKIHPAPYVALPRSVNGPFITFLQAIDVHRSNTFDGTPKRSLTIRLVTAWERRASPAGIAEAPWMTEALDDHGKSLLQEQHQETSWFKTRFRPSSSSSTTLLLSGPQAEAKKIRSLKGYYRLLFAAKGIPFVIENPLKEAERSATAGSARIAITAAAREKWGAQITLDIRPMEQEFDPSQYKIFSVAECLQAMSFVSRSGKRYPGIVTTTLSGTARAGLEFTSMDIPSEEEIVGWEGEFVTRWAEKKIEFSFTDLELP